MILFLHVVPSQSYITAARLNPRSSVMTTTTFSNGSWFAAPYLTKHGEIDPGLRQRHQLILNQKRYDRILRDAWLMINASIWSTIARKLEGEVNGGGWESI
jgi:E3 ubiquitin-protein ligase UBR1